MSFQDNSIYWVEVEKIVPNPYQPRREFDEHKLRELGESIRMYGVLQPLTVTRKEVHREDGTFYTEYELIAGERRLRASKLAGLEQVPVIIRSGEDTEQEKLELAIIENLQREDLNAVDRALAFQQLATVFDMSHGEVAKKVGRSREYVSNSIRLLLLPEYMLSSIKTGDITEGHARALLMLKERPEEQDVVYREILMKKLSVREVERITRKIATDKVRKKDWVGTDSVLIEIEREFTDTLGTRVQIQKTDFGGKLTIDYFSDEDLKRLLEMMKTQGKITDFHTSTTDSEGKESDAVMVQSLAAATPLELIDEQVLPQEATPTAIEAITHEAAVTEVLEDTVLQHAEYVESHPSVADDSRYRYEQNWQYQTPVPPTSPINQSEVTPTPQVPPPAQSPVTTVVSVPPEVAKVPPVQSLQKPTPPPEPDDSDLYSLKNFSV
jgi:ParB family transcriptional regulator, chromosome partitioning protein